MGNAFAAKNPQDVEGLREELKQITIKQYANAFESWDQEEYTPERISSYKKELDTKLIYLQHGSLEDLEKYIKEVL